MFVCSCCCYFSLAFVMLNICYLYATFQTQFRKIDIRSVYKSHFRTKHFKTALVGKPWRGLVCTGDKVLALAQNALLCEDWVVCVISLGSKAHNATGHTPITLQTANRVPYNYECICLLELYVYRYYIHGMFHHAYKMYVLLL